MSQGQVTLELQPEWQDTVLVVKVSATTHSGDLGTMNLAAHTHLAVGDTRVAPTQSGSLSGHHAQTTLVFRLSKQPAAFTIEIRDVPDVPLRVLKWPKGDPVR